MKSLKILGVHRNKKFSPNHIGNDEAIFTLTGKALQNLGCEVNIISEEAFLNQEVIEEKYIFTMAREKDVVRKLQELEKDETIIINSSFSIENCFRIRMHNALESANIPVPESIIVDTENFNVAQLEKFAPQGFWIKRGDFHAIHKEDVTFVPSVTEGAEILREYALREIPDALISAHLKGDLVKFYGVLGTDFFYWFYPYDHNHHKYASYEEVNGKSVHYNFDENELCKIATASATAVGVDIYGGDAIVGKDGSFHIIDLNDWPSFAPCRDEAANQIAKVIFNKFTRNAK